MDIGFTAVPLDLWILRVRNRLCRPDPEAQTHSVTDSETHQEHTTYHPVQIQLPTGIPLGPSGPGLPLVPGSPCSPFKDNSLLLFLQHVKHSDHHNTLLVSEIRTVTVGCRYWGRSSICRTLSQTEL